MANQQDYCCLEEAGYGSTNIYSDGNPALNPSAGGSDLVERQSKSRKGRDGFNSTPASLYIGPFKSRPTSTKGTVSSWPSSVDDSYRLRRNLSALR